MRQLTLEKPRHLRFWDVPEPRLSAPGEALVRPFIAARCDGDALFLRHDYEPWLRLGARLHAIDSSFARSDSDPFCAPFAYGHECVAEVVRVGEAVANVAVGDVVIVPWAISCGACARCDHGLSSHCAHSRGALAAYGFGDSIGGYGGMLSDLVRVPYADAMLVKAPANIDPLALASASDNLPDAYRAVGPALDNRPNAPVLVVGGHARSIGLYAAGLAVALGASRVDYVDDDTTRLAIAERLGAHAIDRGRGAGFYRRAARSCADGYPITVDASSTAEGLGYALTQLAYGGECTAVGFYLRERTPLPLWKMYMRSASLHVGVGHARTFIPSVLELIAERRFAPEQLAPLVADWEDAPRALTEDATKVVVRRKPLGTRSTVPLAS